MRSLFVRIFLWHWLSLAALVIASWVTQTLIAPDVFTQRFSFIARGEMFSFGQTAAAAYTRDGCAGVENLTKQFASLPDAGPRILLRENGHPVCTADSKVLKEVEALALASQPGRFVPRGRTIWLAVRFASLDGTRYLAAGAFPRGVALTRRRIYSLLFLLCLSGAVSWFLASHLAKPLRRLRAVTHQFAPENQTNRIDDFDYMASRIEQLVADQHQSLIKQRELFFDISHELRSPLTRLVVAAGLLRRANLTEPAPFLDRIDREASNIDNLIGQLLTLARLESTAPLEEVEEFDLGALLTEIAADAQFEAATRGCAVRLTLGQNCIVHGSPGLLRSAVDNVVRNAVRYTASQSEISLKLEVSGKRAIVTVSDEGPGVPASDLDHLFDLFFRSGATREQAARGTGLGLAITKRAIEMHNGRVQALARLPHGLEIRMELECD